MNMMTRNILVFTLLLCGMVLSVQGQILKTELNRRMDAGAEMMFGEKYDSADVEFTVVLKNMKPLPSRMAYFYGRNSFHLGEYKRAINWLNKYIQLKGTTDLM